MILLQNFTKNKRNFLENFKILLTKLNNKKFMENFQKINFKNLLTDFRNIRQKYGLKSRQFVTKIYRKPKYFDKIVTFVTISKIRPENYFTKMALLKCFLPFFIFNPFSSSA